MQDEKIVMSKRVALLAAEMDAACWRLLHICCTLWRAFIHMVLRGLPFNSNKINRAIIECGEEP